MPDSCVEGIEQQRLLGAYTTTELTELCQSTGTRKCPIALRRLFKSLLIEFERIVPLCS
jgi:hypothetical protein